MLRTFEVLVKVADDEPEEATREKLIDIIMGSRGTLASVGIAAFAVSQKCVRQVREEDLGLPSYLVFDSASETPTPGGNPLVPHEGAG